MKILHMFLIIIVLVFTFSACANSSEEGDSMKKMGNAPEFPSNLEWLNTNKPLKLADLKGKFVLLDFWTYCCINCMHVIPDLKRLEEKYPNELVVIGVHSAKFFTEKNTDNIRQAILRYEIEHPVVNDRDFEIWRAYGVRAWPTVVLIDPNGDLIGYKSGEGVFAIIDLAMQENIPKYKGVLDLTPPEFELEMKKMPESILRFPGKVLADETTNQLYISDSNHHRILITDFDGQVLDVIGSGEQGQQDGDFASAEFFQPQGMAIDHQDTLHFLYIADTKNHLIRKADLQNRTVETIAGTGSQVYNRNPRGNASKMGLNSPWDLVIHQNNLYIAMAGPHQLWAIDLPTNQIRLHAGSGIENIEDGKLKESALAQPSGITTDGKKLYFADSEVSAIRSADIDEKGEVRTIIGHGLFEFGDEDGGQRAALFQHPLGVIYVNGSLYVADTYNNKIKKVDPVKRVSETYAGTGAEGMSDGMRASATFDEPGGISHAHQKLYIADTNNHLIRVIDLETEQVSSLKLKNINQLYQSTAFDPEAFEGKIIQLDTVSTKFAQMTVNIDLPTGYKLNPYAPSQVRLFSGDSRREFDLTDTIATFSVDEFTPDKTVYAEIIIYYCEVKQEGLCLIKNMLFQALAQKEGSDILHIDYQIRERR